MAGEVWTYIPEGAKTVAGYSGATPLAIAANTVTTGENAVAAFNASAKDGLTISIACGICSSVLCRDLLVKHRR